MAKRTRKRTANPFKLPFDYTPKDFDNEIRLDWGQRVGGIAFARKGEWWICYYGYKGGPELSRVKHARVFPDTNLMGAFIAFNTLILGKSIRREQRKITGKNYTNWGR